LAITAQIKASLHLAGFQQRKSIHGAVDCVTVGCPIYLTVRWGALRSSAELRIAFDPSKGRAKIAYNMPNNPSCPSGSLTSTSTICGSLEGEYGVDGELVLHSFDPEMETGGGRREGLKDPKG
jgi:hypothetical protein